MLASLKKQKDCPASVDSALLKNQVDEAESLIDRIFKAVGKSSEGFSQEIINFAKKYGLNIHSPRTKILLESLNMQVIDFIAKYRRGSIKGEFPKEFLEPGVTIRQAIEQGGSTVRKLLLDGRFDK